MIVKGREISVQMKTGEVLVYPPDWLLVHDEAADIVRSCDALFLPAHFHHKGRSGADKFQAGKLDEYYGEKVKEWATLAVDVPENGWEYLGVVSRIFYTRDGEHEGEYDHPFLDGVRLYECTTMPAAKLRLPDGCVWNWRGFVSP